MTEFKYIELYEILAVGSFNNFVALSTVVFAYLVSGHFAAKELSRPVAVGFTTLFCSFMIGPITGYSSYFARMHQVSQKYVEAFPDGWALIDFPLMPILVMSLLPIFIIWIASIYYVHFYVRR